MRATEGDNLNHSYRDVKCLQSDLQVRYVVLFRANDKLITQNTPLTDDVRAALLCMTPQRVYSECDNQSLIVKRAGFVKRFIALPKVFLRKVSRAQICCEGSRPGLVEEILSGD